MDLSSQPVVPLGPAPADASSAYQSAALKLTADLDATRLEVPVLPQVAGDVIAICSDSDSDTGKLTRLIQSDQALASNLLRIANSPAYRGAIEVVALQQALTRLGLTAIRDISISITMQALATPLGTYHTLAQDLWHQSLGTAFWAREIARLLRQNVEDAYLCGLLHNVGAPVILRWISEQGLDFTDSEASSLAERFGSAAGLRLAAQWELPSLVRVAICFQDATQIPAALEQPAARVGFVHAAMVLGRHLAATMADGSGDLSQPAVAEAIDRLNLKPEALKQLLERTEDIEQQLLFMDGR